MVEIDPFPARAKKVWSDDERNEFIDFIARNPVAGDEIPKVRWSRKNIGKRGGVRVVYFFSDENVPVFLPTVVRKKQRGRFDAKSEESRGQTGESIESSIQAEDEMKKATTHTPANDILTGLENALAYAKGDKSKGIAHVVQVPIVDVRPIRAKLGLSQDKFAATFGVSAKTVRKWEQGTRRPTGPARVLLNVIDREPEVVKRVLSG